MSLLDDEDILIENVKNTIYLEAIKTLWKDGDLNDVEDVLNKKYIHKEGFSWKRLLHDRTIVYQVEWGDIAVFLCGFEMDRERRLVLTFNLINLHIYFNDKEKEEKFIQDLLDLFGNCMKETFFKPQIEIHYGY